MEIHIVSADDVGDTAKLEEKAASLVGEAQKLI